MCSNNSLNESEDQDEDLFEQRKSAVLQAYEQEPMPEQEVEAIRKKRTVNTEVRQLHWLDYEHCCKILEGGIKA